MDFGGFNFDGINPMELLKNAGQIKKEIDGMQEKLEEISATGSAGGGLVKVTMNGKFQVTQLHIDPIAVDPRDVKMLEDIIIAAMHAANQNVIEEIKKACGPMASQFLGK